MNVNFVGYDENVVTFVADKSLTKTGVPVKLTDNNTVGACVNGDSFCGVCVGLRDGYAAVQLSGYAVLETNSKISIGFVKLVTLANGKVGSSSSGGREMLVINSTDNSAGIVL